MTALAYEAPEATMPGPERPDLEDELLWQAWKAMELPEGLRAEIVEGFIEVSPTGRHRHSKIGFRFRRDLAKFLDAQSSTFITDNDMNVMHGKDVLIPDAYVAPEDDDEFITEDGLGLDAQGVALVLEVVSRGNDGIQRDRVRKRRAYARAGIPVYVIIDDYDDHGHVTVLTSPSPEEANYGDSTRRPYGTDITIPEGPAKGFVIGEPITGPRRSGS
ncbi:Uma2 family endonuclease [Streptomyces chattanoogensis]|uniref:Uma2 family endonuclease n=1 Tax=Streptomyces chattanoogensis TaxID=66876 RepID=UPI0036759AA7